MTQSGRSRPARRRACAALTAVLAVAAGPATAEPQDLPAFGMMGLARGQTAVLSLVDVGAGEPARAACRVTAAFVDARGRVFRDAAGAPVQRTFELQPNVAETLRLRASDILDEGELRRLTRVVLTGPDDGSVSDCRCLMATREVVGRGGRTSYSDVALRPPGGGNPPPPPMCLQAVTSER